MNKLRITFKLLFFTSFISIALCCCTSAEQYKQDLLSNNVNKIDNACYQFGEAKDTSAVKFLLMKILDPRRSTNLKFYGMSVNYYRLVALKKISCIDTGKKLNQNGVDTAVSYFYLNWALAKGYVKSKTEVSIYYFE